MIDTDVRSENDRLVRSGYAAFAAGDLAAVAELFHPNAAWHAGRLGVLSGSHEGWDAIARFFGATMELSQGSFTVTPEETLTNDAGVAVVVRSRAERDGKRLDEQQVHVFRLHEGRVAEVRQFAGAEADAFWS